MHLLPVITAILPFVNLSIVQGQEWVHIKLWTLWPEPELYEQLRPVALYHETAGVLMFLEASVYQVKRVPLEERKDRYGLLVLVMRQWPRGIPRSLIHMWIKDAGPSLETLADLRQGLLSTEEFERRYEMELHGQRHCTVKSYVKRSDESDERVVVEQTYANSPIEYLRLLERLYGKVTLLCWEPGPPCHRYFLLQWLGGANWR